MSKFLSIVCLLAVQLTFATAVFATEDAAQAPAATEQAAVSAPKSNGSAMIAIATGLTITIAAFGGALAQGRAAASALEGIARNPSAAPKVQTPMIIALALIESLVIYALVIAFLLQGKI